MNKSFYGSLAVNNIKKNAKGYVPYMLTCIVSIMLFYILAAITFNPKISSSIMGGNVLQSMLGFGCGVIGIFAAIFLFYTNVFLIKNRKKEIALYNILGMSKRHIGRVLFVETVITSLISLIIGLAGGILFGKLVFLLLLKIMKIKLAMEFGVSIPAVILSAIIFGIIFFVVLLCNLGRIHLSNPMELLGGSQQGEKEPRTKWMIALLGVLTMGSGYYIALTVESPLAALAVFFIAVILVIIGTYFLFTAGSVALLKLLKKKKSFYYKTEHFTAVSGMIYRMKRNAAGLASICILSTMVLVTVSTTVSMQAGLNGMIEKCCPHDVQLQILGERESQQVKKAEEIHTILKPYGGGIANKVEYPYVSTTPIRAGNTFRFVSSGQMSMNADVVQMSFIPIKGSSLEKKYGPLAQDEAIVSWTNDSEPLKADTVKAGSTELKVKEADSDFRSVPEAGGMTDAYFVLVADKGVMNQIYDQQKEAGKKFFIGIDMADGADSDIQPMVETLRNELSDNIRIESKMKFSQNSHMLYGGLLFIGIFLGLLFLITTALIIYYKQISEGYEDSERYKIMQKVGMSQAEVKKSIKNQILLVFFLPLVVAIIHVAAAFRVMSKLLLVLQLNNIWLFVVCTGITILVFAVIYIIVYSLTAREYYKLVR